MPGNSAPLRTSRLTSPGVVAVYNASSPTGTVGSISGTCANTRFSELMIRSKFGLNSPK
jgi:hypothetical protein